MPSNAQKMMVKIFNTIPIQPERLVRPSQLSGSEKIFNNVYFHRYFCLKTGVKTQFVVRMAEKINNT